MALRMKVLAHVAAQHARLIGEATPKTPAPGLSRFFSPVVEEFEQSAGKRVLSGSPSNPSTMPRVPALPAAELARRSFLARRAGRAGRAYNVTLAADTPMAEGGHGAVSQLARLLGRGQDGSKVPAPNVPPQRLPVSLGHRPGGVRGPPSYDDAREKKMAEQVSEPLLARQSCIDDRSAATSADVWAELLGCGQDASNAPTPMASQSLPVLLGQRPREVRRPPNFYDANQKDVSEQVREAFLARQSRIVDRSVATSAVVWAELLGRGQDASNAPTSMAPQRLPVLLGQYPREVRRPQNFHDATQMVFEEQVREAFLARQSRITDRDVASMVP